MGTPPVLHNGFRQLYQQSLVAADVFATPARLNFANQFSHPIYGDNVLLLVPTGNQFKLEVLTQKVEGELKEGVVVPYQYNVETDAPQPYDKKGIDCLVGRIKDTVAFIRKNSHLLKEFQIGTVVVGGIENYIRRSKVDRSGACFGVILLYNLTTHKMVQGLSKGVPTQEEFLNEARAYGFSDMEDEKLGGLVSYGEILKQHFGVQAQRSGGSAYEIAKDWHKVVSGVSRYELLKEAVEALGPIL